MDVRHLLLVRRRRPVGEPPEVEAALASGALVVEAAIGGTRIGDLLERLAPRLLPPSGASVSQWLPDLEGDPGELGATELGARFAAVVLASHLVNLPGERLRRALLGATARHATPGSTILVEHHPVDWLETAAESWTERPGSRLGMVEVERNPPFVSAVSLYEAGSSLVRQPFTARVLSEAELGAELVRAGLAVRRRLSPTWVEARPAADFFP